jgi:glucose/arabinose dehydrogenase
MVRRAARTGAVMVILLLAALPAFVVTRPAFVSASDDAFNPVCPTETAFYDPGTGQNIVLPSGFKVSVFAKKLNFPTGIAFLGDGDHFKVFVLESGHGLPSRCNDETSVAVGGEHSTTNPFTPDILEFDEAGGLPIRTLAKPTAAGIGLQPHGPAIDIAFEHGFEGGRLFATDSNQATHAGGQNNSSRIVTVDPDTGQVTPLITDLPTGDHPTEQLAFKGEFIYWSQGSTTNSGVVGRDNGGGANQQDIPCQDIMLSKNVFDSGLGKKTSGYEPFGVQNPGGTVKAFASAKHHGVCDGAILRARLDDPVHTIEPFSWGYRNGYAIRFAPDDHALKGGLLVGEDGADERGARPTNNAPDMLDLAQMNPDGTPDYHGWPDRLGFLETSQAVFNPVGGPGDDLCGPPVVPAFNQAACLAALKAAKDIPIRPVLDHPPQQITSPLAIEAADSSFTGIDFVPGSFAGGLVKRGAALYTLEGDFGFSAANATSPAPEVGHEIKLINFSRPNQPLELKIMRFAHNTTFEQAFPDNLPGGFNRPTNVKFGPDGCAYVVDYGVVRDFGQSDPASKFLTAGDGPLVQIPGTGTIWKICRH